MVSGRMIAAVLALAALADSNESPREYEDRDYKPIGRGRVCGRDDGKGSHRTQQRNAACACGSGDKFKRCCGKGVTE